MFVLFFELIITRIVIQRSFYLANELKHALKASNHGVLPTFMPEEQKNKRFSLDPKILKQPKLTTHPMICHERISKIGVPIT